MSIGQKIEMLRRKRGLSQKELAQLLDVTTAKVAEWESDETSPSINEISQMCTLFKISSDYLILEDKNIVENMEKNVCDMKKKKNKLGAFVALCCLGALIGTVLILYVFIPNYKYHNAEKLIARQRYVEAYKVLENIGNKKSLATMKKIKSEVNQEKIIGSNVRDVVQFGAYEQDNNKKNGKEEIEWIVLAKEENRTLLVSKKGVDVKKYASHAFAAETWEESVVREWLNADFLEKTFDGNEQNMIEITKVINNDNYQHGTEGGNDTLDKIFLLSYEEVNEYFVSAEDRTCQPTEYALERCGSFTLSGNGDWWLRTVGSKKQCQMLVTSEGGYEDSYSAGSFKLYLRPAIWVNHDL